MPQWLLGTLISIVSMLIGAGTHKWLFGASHLYEKERVREALKKEFDKVEADLVGARKAMKQELNGLGRRVDASDAAARLAVQNADEALHTAEEIRQIVEVRLGHIEETLRRGESREDARTASITQLTSAVAAQTAALERLSLRRRDDPAG